MSFLPNVFYNKYIHELPSKLDMHSHLIPEVDDGSHSIEDSIDLIKEFKRLGYNKAITTPHVMTDAFDNTPEIIRKRLDKLKMEMKKSEIDFDIDFAAEYYVDEFFLRKISVDKLMTFGKSYVLIETGTLNYPKVFREVIFELRVNGYEPVFAHPERYAYLWGPKAKNNYRNFKDMELFFQINIISLGGYYSPQVMKMAELLIKENMVDFIGTDAHDKKYMLAVEESLKSKYIDKLLKIKLLNDTLY